MKTQKTKNLRYQLDGLKKSSKSKNDAYCDVIKYMLIQYMLIPCGLKLDKN